MITLITGTPGTGKTAWMLQQLLEFIAKNPYFYIFVHGVRNLRGIAHETIYCRSPLCDVCRSAEIPETAKYVEDWTTWKEPQSLIVVDEVQRIWRPRVGSAKISDAVSTLETHRHYGVDFWLISQGPHLFDNFIRLLVGRHIHLVSSWSGRKQFEWSECKQDLTSRGDAIVRPYTLPKHVFDHYDSAEVHTTQDKRKPMSFYAVIILFFVAAALIYNVYTRMATKTAIEQGVDTQKTPENAQKLAEQDIIPIDLSKTDKTLIYPDFKPTIEGVLESAPAYVPLLKVTAVPTLQGCVYSKKKDDCKCYTKQATVYPTSKKYCLLVIADNHFDPYIVHVPPPPPVASDDNDKKKDKLEDEQPHLVSADIHTTPSDDL